MGTKIRSITFFALIISLLVFLSGCTLNPQTVAPSENNNQDNMVDNNTDADSGRVVTTSSKYGTGSSVNEDGLEACHDRAGKQEINSQLSDDQSRQLYACIIDYVLTTGDYSECGLIADDELVDINIQRSYLVACGTEYLKKYMKADELVEMQCKLKIWATGESYSYTDDKTGVFVPDAAQKCINEVCKIFSDNIDCED